MVHFKRGISTRIAADDHISIAQRIFGLDILYPLFSISIRWNLISHNDWLSN